MKIGKQDEELKNLSIFYSKEYGSLWSYMFHMFLVHVAFHPTTIHNCIHVTNPK